MQKACAAVQCKSCCNWQNLQVLVEHKMARHGLYKRFREYDAPFRAAGITFAF